jgi:ribosomal-protein-alanine N-acetyltransferase
VEKVARDNWGGPQASRVRSFATTISCVASTIRDFRAEDFDLLWRMDQECFPPEIAYSRQELKTYIRTKGAFTLVASDGNKDAVDGFLVAYGGPIGHIITIDVAAKTRRSGVGSLLLLTAEERLRTSGSHAVSLETAVDNMTALAFYKRHGYHVIRTWPRYYANGLDALVLKKSLG